MLRRLLIGLLIGFFVGGLLAAGLVVGLGVRVFDGTAGAALAYATAVLTGIVSGLVAGKPIWAAGARVEAGLKSFFGALIAGGIMFALRRWASAWVIDLGAVAGGPAAVGQLPAASLPIIGAALGALFEVDNTGGPDADAETKPRRSRVRAPPKAATNGETRPVEDELPSAADTEMAPRRAKR